jgi:two-component system sensor histidine kinase HydH
MIVPGMRWQFKHIFRNSKLPKRNLVLNGSPWLILALALLLGGIVAVTAVQNAKRERRIMARNLKDRAQALILAVEAGARAGMGMHVGEPYLQSLVEETAKQPGIVSMVVTDGNGRIRADSNRDRIGQQFVEPGEFQGLKPEDGPKWRLGTLEGVGQVFEVYKCFTPLPAGPAGMMLRMRSMMGMEAPPGDALQGAGQGKWPVIAVALDIRPYQEAMEHDLRHSVMMAALLALVALGGMVSLFWLQRSRLSSRLLQDARAFATEVVTSLPVGLLTTDPQGRVNLVNAAAAGILGKNPDRLEGTPLAGEDSADWEAIERRVTEGEVILEKEMDLHLPGGKEQPVSVSASRIVNEEGGFLGNLFILRSLGEVRELQERLRRSERLSSLGNLAAGVAHEVRNPLSSIRGFASYLAGKLRDSPDQEAARVMVQEVDRLNRVVSQLLEFARPDDVHRTVSDLNAVVDHALRLASSDAAAKGIEVRFVPNPRLPRILLDPDRMAQALLNLVLNAIQAMDTGGVLTVAAGRAEGGVSVLVNDTGPGMTREVAAQVFNPYFTTKPSGTGLGLAIVHNIVENHHGAVSVESRPGRGTTFTVFLPGAASPDQGGH